MPTYCFQMPGGEIIERTFEFGKAPDKIDFPDGQTAIRSIAAEHHYTCVKGGTGVKQGGWPMRPCIGSGVHPSQAGELRNHFKKHGLNVEVNNAGDPIYESAVQRKKALECRGLHDKN